MSSERTGWGSIQYGEDRFLIYSYIPDGTDSPQSAPGVDGQPAAAEDPCCFRHQSPHTVGNVLLGET